MRTCVPIASVALVALLTACGPIRVPGAPEPDAQPQADAAPAAAPDQALTEPAPAPTAEAETRVTITRAPIDWDAARRDMAAQPVPDDGAVTIASGPTDTVVPILLPSSPVMTASADGEAMRFRPLDDGYYAVIPGPGYDMIINGTDKLTATPGRTPGDGETVLRFEETMTGAQVAFSRYGASYLVEFACTSDETITGPSCVSEDDALAAVEDLLIAGTQ